MIAIGNYIGKKRNFSWATYWTSPEGLALKAKILLWTSKENEKVEYYIDQIGVQDRQSTLDGITPGIIQPGRAIAYDASKTQRSSSVSYVPVNFRLYNNSVTMSFKFKIGAIPSASYTFLQAGNMSAAIVATGGSAGVMQFVIVPSTGSESVSFSLSSVCDGLWHSAVLIADKTGYAKLYVDKIMCGQLDISGKTFNDPTTSYFVVGTASALVSGLITIRDLRIFDFALSSVSDIEKIYNGDYVAGCVSWYFMEGGKEGSIYSLRDNIGVNHLININFDGSSLVTGAWCSLFNKFGYAGTYDGPNMVPEGTFTDKVLWYNGQYTTRWTITGTLKWLATDDLAPYIGTLSTMSYAQYQVLKITFNVISATAKFAIGNQASQTLVAATTYNQGANTLIIRAAYAGTGFRLTASVANGAFEIDDFVAAKYDVAPVMPKMTSAIPTLDVWDRTLLFHDSAKNNLIKVNSGTVKLPDYEGKCFFACEKISVNDWYDVNGLANEISKSNIVSYQTGRQYYKNGELIIIRSDFILTPAEDKIIRNYMGLGTPNNIFYPVYKSIGTLEGTTAQIYATAQAIINSDPTSEIIQYNRSVPVFNATAKYLASSWSDLFLTDFPYTIAMAVKYGFSNSFTIPIYPLKNDPLHHVQWDIDKVRMIERSGNYIGNHGIVYHFQPISSHPLADGRTNPSNDMIRVERSDGTNAFGYDVDATVDASVGESLRIAWLRLSAELGAKAWKDLSDADCIAIRKTMSLFGGGFYTYDLCMLQSMDVLSNRYCNTSGYSVLNGDYATRTPNTVGGVEPDSDHRIQGGIFQGAVTTRNHEVWERLFTLRKAYEIEFLGKINEALFFNTPGGIGASMAFRPIGWQLYEKVYQDDEHTKLFGGAAQHTSSITGTKRSLIESARSTGYKVSFLCEGMGFGYPTADGITRMEAQRIYKKNGFKKPDVIGDGFQNMLRPWSPTISEANQTTLLASTDLVKELFDITFASSDSAFTPGSNFDDVLRYITKWNAWGIIPDAGDDSGTTGAGISSYVMVLEALYQFCKRAGITVISHEEAGMICMRQPYPAGYNYFPNNTFEKLIATITESTNAPTYPDGWNGGVVVSEDTGIGVVNCIHYSSAGTIFIRQYAIKPGTFNLSFKAKGVGTLIIRKIINTDLYNETSGAAFTTINTITINSVADYTLYQDTVVIPDNDLVEYDEPETPTEEIMQSYFKGYDNKICGIQIELVITAGNYVKIGNCSLIE